MYAIATSTFWQAISSFFGLVGGALRLDPAVFRAAQTNTNAIWLTLVILLLAGTSQTLGQSVVLLANKVTPRRFAFSLLLSGALFVVDVLIWAAIFQAVGRLVFGVQLPFNQMAIVVGLAYAPLVLSFFVLLPYAGSFLKHVFDIWSLLAMLVATSVALHLDFWQALFCVLLGWAIIQTLQYTIGRPIVALRKWMIRVTAGAPLSVDVKELVETSARNTTDETRGGVR